MFSVELDQAPERRLATLLHEGPYTEVAQCFDNLGAIASAQNLWPRVRGMVGVHYDDPNVVDEQDLRCHAGLIIADQQSLPDSLEELTLAGDECAVLHYKGPYTAIKVAYDYLYGDWLPKSGREPSDLPPYELYLNSPTEVAESELLTDIVLRLASKT